VFVCSGILVVIGSLLAQGFAGVQVDGRPCDLAQLGLLPHVDATVDGQRCGKGHVVVGARSGPPLRSSD
jgi:hypothetical protein